MNESVSGKIKQRIEQGKTGTIYFAKDFSDLGEDGLIYKALYRLDKNRFLIRITNGIYLYPVIDKSLGILYPSTDSVAKAIAKRDNARILPTGSQALNMLGLSPQVPMNVVYMTDGSPRRIAIGNRKITFKKTSPRNFEYKGKIVPLVVFALKEIGKENITSNHLEQIEKVFIKTEDIKVLLNDVNLAPAWIKKIITPIIKKNED